MRKIKTQKIKLVAFLTLCQIGVSIVPCNVSLAAGLSTEAEQQTNGETEAVPVRELDLGDYESEMEVGAKQLLTVTVLPVDASNQEVTYSSSNQQVATVNGMGRITAIAVGTTEITASCGNITASFQLNVVEPKTEGTVGVVDIEIADYEEELNVDKTMNLSATVLPAEAEAKVSYSSSNTQIATVSSTGEVKGIAPGQVTITVQAGGISKDIVLMVKVATTSIDLNSTYVVLKPGGTYQLSGRAIPQEANQGLTFKSADGKIAAVSGNGTITAKSVGNTTIIVSNGDMSNAVTIIVNEEGKVQSDETDQVEQTTIPQAGEEESKLLALLEQQETLEIKATEYEKITSVVLKALYDKGKNLVIHGKDYTVTLSGKDIVNCENELYTKIDQKQTQKGVEIVLNKGKNLPGQVKVDFAEKENYKYVYLYNKAVKKYERIQQSVPSELKLNTAGTYLLTSKKINSSAIKIYVIAGGVVIILGFGIAYIVVKKKYWFW